MFRKTGRWLRTLGQTDEIEGGATIKRGLVAANLDETGDRRTQNIKLKLMGDGKGNSTRGGPAPSWETPLTRGIVAKGNRNK